MAPDSPISPPEADDELLRRTAAGDADAFAALFERRQGDVYRFALHMTGSAAVADDVTQDVFLAVMRDADRYQIGRSTVIAWLCGIARNMARQRFDRDRPLELIAGFDGGEVAGPAVQPDPVGDIAHGQRIETLRAAVLRLPVRYREAVVLCDLQELTYAEAADAIGCSIGTVRSRLHRGRALLAAKMKAMDRREDAAGAAGDVAPRARRRIPGGCWA